MKLEILPVKDSMRLISAITAVLSTLLLAACVETADGYRLDESFLSDVLDSQAATELTLGEISEGLREALRVGTDRTVSRVSRSDGYFRDSEIHIPLPNDLQKVQSTLKAVGLSHLLDDVELRINRAAEKAAPEAKAIFWRAIVDMTLQDVMDIYQGPDDAATRYFERSMSPALRTAVRPVIDTALSEVGALAAYEDMLGAYRQLPFVPDVRADLRDHTINFALSGLFHYLAEEEAKIRRDPAKRTTEILRKVFG